MTQQDCSKKFATVQFVIKMKFQNYRKEQQFFEQSNEIEQFMVLDVRIYTRTEEVRN